MVIAAQREEELPGGCAAAVFVLQPITNGVTDGHMNNDLHKRFMDIV